MENFIKELTKFLKKERDNALFLGHKCGLDEASLYNYWDGKRNAYAEVMEYIELWQKENKINED